jgi:hypothetical protein
MQVDRIAGVMHLAGSVRGLGVCDVLRVELAPVQRAGLETQLKARTAALERRRADLETAQRALTGPPVNDEELTDVRDELRLLARVRADVPALAPEPFALTGPAGLVLELVGACLTAAVTCADARLGEGELGAAWTGACERELEAAAAWIRTALDCHAVEAFSFEPGVDPVHAW